MERIATSDAGINMSQPERRLVPRALVLIVLALSFWGFLEVADEVAEDDLRELDANVLLAMREPDDRADPLGPVWVEEAARDITALGSFAVLFIVVGGVATFLFLVGKSRAAAFILVSVLSGVLLSSAMKSGFDRPRPDLVAHKMHTLTKSFPSGHALLSAVVYLSLGSLISLTQPKWSVKAFALFVSVSVTLLVGLTRVYLGVHWPTDVVGGWFMGASWAMAWWLLALMVLPRREKHALPSAEPER